MPAVRAGLPTCDRPSPGLSAASCGWIWVVTVAVADNQDAHNTMADYFFTDGTAINSIILALADAFYEAVGGFKLSRC